MLTRLSLKTLGLMILLVAIGVAACVPTAASAPAVQAPAATTAPSAPAVAPVVLQVVDNDKLGKFLADGKGMTLYVFTKDTKDVSSCYDKCATAWPPLLQSDMPTVDDGVTASLLGATTRKDGTLQVTYNGMPLYYYAKDKVAGDVVGQGVSDAWYVVAPDGQIIK